MRYSQVHEYEKDIEQQTKAPCYPRGYIMEETLGVLSIFGVGDFYPTLHEIVDLEKSLDDTDNAKRMMKAKKDENLRYEQGTFA